MHSIPKPLAPLPPKNRAGMPFVALVLAAGAISLAAIASAKAASNPFDSLKGDWQGSGTVWLADGKTKKVDCKVAYKVTGSNLAQTLSCTGDDYEIEAKLKLADKSGKVKGSWNEAIYDASGAVTGSAKEDLIHAVIRGDKFSGRLSLKVTDQGHTINIVQLNEKTGIYRLASSLQFRR
jgi:carbohydrate-selective porin OprB